MRHAVGDGTSMTVTTAYAHRLVPGDIVLHEGAVQELGQVLVGETPDASTYAFSSPLTGLWESGTWRRVTVQNRRRAAVRLLGTQVLFKQWLPHEPEPSWDDLDRTVINLLPDTLPSGAPTPLGPGGVGLLIAHLGDGQQVEVRDLRVTPWLASGPAQRRRSIRTREPAVISSNPIIPPIDGGTNRGGTARARPTTTSAAPSPSSSTTSSSMTVDGRRPISPRDASASSAKRARSAAPVPPPVAARAVASSSVARSVEVAYSPNITCMAKNRNIRNTTNPIDVPNTPTPRS